MTSSTRLGRLAGGMLATALMMAALMMAATAAQAAISLSHSTVSDPDTVGVSLVSLPSGAEAATHVTAAECNVTGAAPGERCNVATAVGFTAVDDFDDFGLDVDVWAAFSDWDFTEQEPALTDSECAETEGEDECGIAVSYYYAPNFPAPPYVPVGADFEPITFQ
jgi:hypothetical protein